MSTDFRARVQKKDRMVLLINHIINLVLELYGIADITTNPARKIQEISFCVLYIHHSQESRELWQIPPYFLSGVSMGLCLCYKSLFVHRYIGIYRDILLRTAVKHKEGNMPGMCCNPQIFGYVWGYRGVCVSSVPFYADWSSGISASITLTDVGQCWCS